MEDLELQLSAFRSVKAKFFDDHRDKPDHEIERLWREHFAYLAQQLGAAPPVSARPLPSTKRSRSKTGEPGMETRTTRRCPDSTGGEAIRRQYSLPSSSVMAPRLSTRTTSSGTGSRSTTSRRHSQRSTRPTGMPESSTLHAFSRPNLRNPNLAYVPNPATSNGRPSNPYPLSTNCRDLSVGDFLLAQDPEELSRPTVQLTPSPTVERHEPQITDPRRLSVSQLSSSLETPPLSRSTSGESITASSPFASALMTRENTNNALVGPFEMCHVGSQHSFTDVGSINPLDTSFTGSFSDSTCATLFTPQSSPSSTLPHLGMQLSLSQTSVKSNSSTESANSSTVRALEQNGTGRPLAPKPLTSTQLNNEPKLKLVDIPLPDGTTQRKAEIPREPTYTKESLKVYCPMCNDQPLGFHGTHELQRHIERNHSEMRRVWVCRDISTNGFLSKCKHCRNNKSYGANYNAAAHLRRVHFNPADSPKGGRGREPQGRGGIGGGDQPPMDVLRHWMYETWESNPNTREFYKTSSVGHSANTRPSPSPTLTNGSPAGYQSLPQSANPALDMNAYMHTADTRTPMFDVSNESLVEFAFNDDLFAQSDEEAFPDFIDQSFP